MLDELFKQWEASGEMTLDLAQQVDKHLDDIMEEGLARMTQQSQQGNHETAFLALNQTTSLVNTSATKQPQIIKKLST